MPPNTRPLLGQGRNRGYYRGVGPISAMARYTSIASITAGTLSSNARLALMWSDSMVRSRLPRS
jgi:hypothetical protein